MPIKIRCANCFEPAKSGSVLSKPKGWIKHKTPDHNVVYFCSQECMKKFIFPAEVKEKRLWRRSKKG